MLALVPIGVNPMGGRSSLRQLENENTGEQQRQPDAREPVVVPSFLNSSCIELAEHA